MTVGQDSRLPLPVSVGKLELIRKAGPMIVIVDERELVTEGYNSLFDREGVACAGFAPTDFDDWVSTAADDDLRSVRAFLIGDCREGSVSPRQIRDRTGAPVIALSEHNSLENTLRRLPSLERCKLVRAQDEVGIGGTTRFERVDRASVLVELDDSLRKILESQTRQLEPRLGRSRRLLMARLGDDEDEELAEPK